MNQSQFDACYGYQSQSSKSREEPIHKTALKHVSNSFTPQAIKNSFYRRVPAAKWLQSYKSSYIVKDIMAGATLGIYNIPQGMAYSVLASLPPVYGLYVSFLPPLLYFIFGSSRHASIGVFSIVCLIIGQTRLSILPDFSDGTTLTTYKGITDLEPIHIVTALSFCTGIIQIVMASFQLNFVTAYLSDPVIAGFTWGAACHAAVSQIPAILGIKPEKTEDTVFKLFFSMKHILDKITSIKYPVLLISSASICFLLIAPRIADFLWKQIRKCRKTWNNIETPNLPYELFLLLGSTALSKVYDFHDEYNVKIIGEIPTGLPPPQIPRFELVPYIFPQSASIAVVAFVITVSMGKTFGKKHNYPIDANQELYALGLTEIASSFFSVMPSSCSLSRTLVNEASGAMTQVSGLVSSLITLSVILVFGPLLDPLPMCVLSCIVIVALRSLLKKVGELPHLWSVSKTDFAVWIITALSVFCWDIIQGLLIGAVFGIFSIVYRTQRVHVQPVGQIAEGTYREKSLYAKASSSSSPIITFDGPLIFTNVEPFKRKMAHLKEYFVPEVVCNKKMEIVEEEGRWNTAILDCTGILYTDVMGIDAIIEVDLELKKENIILLLVNVRGSVREQYANAGLFAKVSENQFYPDIQNALKAADQISDLGDKFLKNSDDLKVSKC